MTGLAAFFSASLIDGLRLDLAIGAMKQKRVGAGGEFRRLAQVEGGQLHPVTSRAAHAGLAQSCGRTGPASADGRVEVIFDGAIYNRRDLAAELGLPAAEPEASSDVGLIVAGYRKWGAEVLPRINGVWACIILDLARCIALFSRDRFGARPLYYARTSGAVWLASDASALLNADAVRFDPNLPVIANYVVAGELDTSPATFFNDILSTPPATVVTIDLRRLDAPFEQNLFYRLPSEPLELPFNEYAGRFRDCLVESVRLRAAAGGAVGSCLSGGIDSTSIVSAMNHLGRSGASPDDTNLAFGFCADDAAVNERPFMEIAARHASRDLVTITPDRASFLAEIETVLERFDEPVSSSSVAAQSLVFSSAKSHGVAALLDGRSPTSFLPAIICTSRSISETCWSRASGRLR